MADTVTGCVHREDYSVRRGVFLDLHTEPPDGPRYRLTPSGFTVFADENRERDFQDWHLVERGAAHSDPCPHRPAWVHSSLMPQTFPTHGGH